MSGVNICGAAFCHATKQRKKSAGNRFCLSKYNEDQAKVRARNETIIKIYAPCNDTYSEEEKAEFCEKLSGTI